MDPQQQVMRQQFTSPIPLYQFQQISYNMLPLQQTKINRTPAKSNLKNDTQNEKKITLGNR
jgi:hypothetical protein